MKQEPFSFKKRARSFRYAFNGIRLLLSTEHNARIHTVAAVCAVCAGFIFGISAMEWMVVIILIGIVFAAEAFNSALEVLSDYVSPEYREAIGRAKDLAAGAVLCGAIAAAITGCVIFLPYIF